MRSALGAGRRRIIRQVLTESLVLAALGGVAGGRDGAAILRVAPVLVPAGLLPGVLTLAFDGRVLTFCVAAAAVVAVLFGLAPAWQASGLTLSQGWPSRPHGDEPRRNVPQPARRRAGGGRGVAAVWRGAAASNAAGRVHRGWWLPRH